MAPPAAHTLDEASSVTFDTTNGLRYAVLTGRVSVALSTALEPTWTSTPVSVDLLLPEMPSHLALSVVSIAPTAVPVAAIPAPLEETNAAVAIRSVSVDPPGAVISAVRLNVVLEHRYLDGVATFTYTVHVLGSMVPRPPKNIAVEWPDWP